MQHRIEVSVANWSAWAPGLSTRADWRGWARGEREFGAADEKPPCAFIKPMLRRRMSRLSRMALEVAEACREEEARPYHVFCSRYGEYARTTEILFAMARGEPMSPAAFSQSVHNTSAGLFTISHQDTAPSTTVAAGEATLEAGFLEAYTALATGAAKEVLVVYHDEPLDALYGKTEPALPAPLAAAFLLRLPQGGDETVLQLECASAQKAVSNGMHPVLQVIRILTGEAERAEAATPRLVWEWQRCAAA